MKNIVKTVLAAASTLVLAAGCIQESFPAGSTATANQVAAAPGSFDKFVDAITSTLVGQFVYAPTSTNAYDFGLPAFFIRWDSMGNDLVQPALSNGWFNSWYCIDHLGPTWANSQFAWTFYYSWIKACNNVISLAGEDPEADKVVGAGIARFYRAYFYMDLAQMFATKPCYVDASVETVPLVVETTTLEQLADNPRATNAEIYAQYAALAVKEAHVIFGGRLAEYYYFDMDKVGPTLRSSPRSSPTLTSPRLTSPVTSAPMSILLTCPASMASRPALTC